METRGRYKGKESRGAREEGGGGEREEGGDKEGRKGGEKKEQGRVRDIN